MKKLVLCFTLCAGMFGSVFAQSNYYWYKGQKITLTKNDSKKFILVDSGKSKNDISESLKISKDKVDKFSYETMPNTVTPFKGEKFNVKKWAVIHTTATDSRSTFTKNEDITYEAPFFYTEKNAEIGLSNFFYVKLKSPEDVKKLEQLAEKNNIEIVGNNKFMPLWYTLSCSKNSSGNALEMANQFFESGFFSASEPDFIEEDLTNCVNDNFFSNQWALDNTGQGNGTSGIDIHMCEAWQTTTGDTNIVIAILDHGIEMNHPDLPNIFPLSFDTESGTSPSQVLGDHGTACAGIVGANSDNSIGVAGMAPDCPLMSISNSLYGNPNSRQARADGFNWAWQNGAAVISNSWGSGVQYQIIDDAIENAQINGRNGLGTVIVFSAGNNNTSSVSYPANANPDIIAVGAMSPCGERKNLSSCDNETWWGSDYGTDLDVVAPGVLIPTTDRQGIFGYSSTDYTQTFNGTSSACPHVAALAGLILSVNPNLTQKQVADIIEQTAQKVGGYNYQTTSGRPNGTWDDEMGYGLIDAEAAVLAANSSTVDLLDEFNVPRSSGIPTGFRKYSNVHTLGTGGPDLSNVFNSVFNWHGSSGNPNGLYQFTLETTDGNPSYYTDMVSHASYTLHQSNPEIEIYTSVGFADLDGDYWVNLDGSNLVLVEKSGDYALYFSNSSTPPSLRKADLGNMENVFEEDLISATASPNPFSNAIEVHIPENMGAASVIVVDSKGTSIETLSTEGGNVSLGNSYAPGIYMIKIVGETGVEQLTVIKQ